MVTMLVSLRKSIAASQASDYQSLFKEVDLATSAAEVHDGYFSIDKKKVGNKTVKVFKDTKGHDPGGR